MTGAADGDRREGRDEVGSLSEETGRLLGSLASWAREHGSDLGHGLEDFAEHVSESMQDVDAHLATGSVECTVCPVCRAVHAVRDLSPEVKAHLTSAATSLLQAAVAVVASTTAGGSPRERGRRDTQVERIDVDDDWPVP